MRSILLILLSLFILKGHSQNNDWSISGSVVNKNDQAPVIGATVQMVNIKDSTKSRYASVNIDGGFKVEQLEQAFYRLKISSIGFKPYQKLFRLTATDIKLSTIFLEPDMVLLKEVSIEGQIIPVQQKGDTTQYNAAAFKTNPDANASDLVSKMPGIVIDENGVSANGENIDQVLLDGKRFFGQDPLLSLNTIPAEIVDQVQVYDEQSEQSKLTGFDDGNTTKSMNLITKEGKKNGQFGRIYGGISSDDLYKAGATINTFKKDRRITILGMSNNINQQNFGSEDLIGISNGGGRGGFRRGGNSSFISGTQDGITTTNSLGINFTDKLGKKTSLEGSYFYNHSNNAQVNQLNRESFLQNGSQFYSENQESNSKNENHRLNLRVDHKINDNNQIFLRTAFSYQNNESEEITFGENRNSMGNLLSQTQNNYSSLNTVFNLSNNLIYQHKFEKVGRTISFELNNTIKPTDGEDVYTDLQRDSLIEYFNDEQQYSIGSSVTYTEPIGTTAQLSIKYEGNYTFRESDNDTYIGQSTNDEGVFNQSLSNQFESLYTTHVPSISYSKRQFGKFLNIELAYQSAQLKNEWLIPDENKYNRQFNNLLPSIRSRFELSKDLNLFVRFATSTTEPSIDQLQNVIKNSDPLFVTIGNSQLKQTYNNSLSFRFQGTKSEKDIVFSNSFSAQSSSNYISSQTTILDKDSTIAEGVSLQEGAQVTKPVNVNGYWSLRNTSTFGVLIKPIKNNLNTTLGLSYVKLPGITNNIANTAETYSADFKIGLTSNISEKIDYNFYYQIVNSQVINSIQNGSKDSYYTQTLGFKLNLNLKHNFVFRNETYFQRYRGINNSFDSEYTLWNIGIAKKFLKNNSGELEFSVFDLLGENQSFNQEVTSRYIEESQTKVLQQYFMLTFTYQFRKFN